MRRTRAIGLVLGFAAPLVAACTADNPLFGVGDGSGSATTTDGASSDVETTAPSGSADGAESSASGGESTGGDAPVCGNGLQEEGEACDLGEQNAPTAACQLDCTDNECGDGKPGPGQPCDDGPDGSAACSPECIPLSCGDGVVQRENGEQCEPGLDPLCTPACTVNLCGDGFLLGDEACDDNNADNTDACVADCQHAACGDGYVHAGVEQCDDDNGYNTDACLVDCALASCGDGHVHAGVEDCDDENGSNLDGCLVDCTLNTCGDGFLNPMSEQCDGNVQQSCDELGFDGGEAVCGPDCNVAGCSTCGDGVLGAGEQCDPGSFVDTTCAQAGLEGVGTVSCDEASCTLVIGEGDCCAPAGASCMDAIGCCNGCDELTEQCSEG
jgi:cysteine-rich repeat protein